MDVLIRVDASLESGTGHVMRCLTLAHKLRAGGGRVMFVCREERGHLCELVEEKGYLCARLAAPALIGAEAAEFDQIEDARQTCEAMAVHGWRADLLVIDHYRLDKTWESVLRSQAARVFVIDDLANRIHDCDVLLDQNLHDSPDTRYHGLVPDNARVFVGPKYALLRPEFSAVAPVPRVHGLRRILAFFGGVDPTNEALKLVEALRLIGASAPNTDLVLGPSSPNHQLVSSAASTLEGVRVLARADDMATLMRSADLGVGTCGVAAWERCSVGLPSLVVISADNQRDDARILEARGAARNLGDASKVSIAEWASGILQLRAPALLRSMSVAAISILSDREQAMSDLEAALVT